MLIKEPTPEMILEWKRIFEEFHSKLKPNRKSGNEVDQYFRKKYPHHLFENSKFCEVAALNILENDFFKNKLPEGTPLNIKTYKTGNVLVAIDLCTGEFHIESENIKEAIPIYDDLFVYRGLDEEDLKNFFLVAEYVTLSKNIITV